MTNDEAIADLMDLMKERPLEALSHAVACLRGRVPDGWIKTSDRLPEKPGKSHYEYVECLIFHKGEVKMRPWNCEHLCWDDEAQDNFFCHPLDPTHWMPLPQPPREDE